MLRSAASPGPIRREEDSGMNISTETLTIATGYASTRYRSVGCWLATVPVVAELGLGKER